MRALKTILIIAGALAAIALVLTMVGAKHFRVERSAVIKAPVDVVFPYVSSLRNMEAWGPWKEMEHNMTTTYEGEDGTVGARSMWTSDESQGAQELTAIDPGKSVRTKLTFVKPWAAENTGTFDLEAMGDSTKVTWGIEGDNDWKGRIMSVFMDMDKMVGPMFEKGLANMKGIAEPEATKKAEEAKNVVDGFRIETVDRGEMVYVGKRSVVKWKDMKDYYATNIPATMMAVTKAGLTPSASPSGVYWKWDVVNQEADMMAAIPVKGDASTKAGKWETFVLPAGKAYFIKYTGGYMGSGKAHEAMDKKMKADGVDLRDVVLEEYVNGPAQEPDSNLWVTNIFYMLK